MTAKELIEKLQKMDPDSSVIIIPKGSRYINPRAQITGVYEGFDWYSGSIILATSEE